MELTKTGEKYGRKMKISKYKKFVEQLKNTSCPFPLRKADNGSKMVAGQTWSVTGGCGKNTPTWLLLLVKKTSESLFNAVPLFRWGELAGPDDVYLPRELAGADIVASLEMEATVDRTMLDDCHGRLSEKAVRYVRTASATLDNPVQRNKFSWGIDYLGSNDHRLLFHRNINDRLTTLQENLRTFIFQK